MAGSERRYVEVSIEIRWPYNEALGVDNYRVVADLDSRKELFLRQVGAKISYFRILMNMSQHELAEKAHISQSAMSRIERGKYNENISLMLLYDIAEGLHIDVSMLVDFDERETKMIFKSLKDT